MNCENNIESAQYLVLIIQQMRGSENSDVYSVVFLVINVFHRGPYGTPSRGNWTLGVQLLLEGVHTRISKGIYI